MRYLKPLGWMPAAAFATPALAGAANGYNGNAWGSNWFAWLTAGIVAAAAVTVLIALVRWLTGAERYRPPPPEAKPGAARSRVRKAEFDRAKRHLQSH